MPELLIEVFSEEIPARMQRKAAEDLKRLITGALSENGLSFESAKGLVTPRRLILVVDGLISRQPDSLEERRGPRTSAPPEALSGFLSAAGVTLQECRVEKSKRGEFYVATIQRSGVPTKNVIAEFMPQILKDFPWPKSMRWGDGSLKWVRPLHSILCVFDSETVPFEISGISSGSTTLGHRFLSPLCIDVKRFDAYEQALRRSNVIIDPDEREDLIRQSAREMALSNGLVLVEDEGLISENSGLTEWPIILIGDFDQKFLDLPEEVILTSLRSHQKCFGIRNKDGCLTNKFILVANMEASDGGRCIVQGNNRVISARLSDAKFFWDQDRSTPLSAMVEKLKYVRFQEKLGQVSDKVQRVAVLAENIAIEIGIDPVKTKLAAEHCKADLVSGLVGEFPELQGLMGGRYALEQGLDVDVAYAIADHYRPQGPRDALPRTVFGSAVAIADKLDTLAGFWFINEKPSGSKDPYALRRAAYGIIRIILEGNLRLSLLELCKRALSVLDQRHEVIDSDRTDRLSSDLFQFFIDRLKTYMRDLGRPHDLIEAVAAIKCQQDLWLIWRRVESLGQFLQSEDGAALLNGVKRAGNILKIEEAKDGVNYIAKPDPSLFASAEERELSEAVDRAEKLTDLALLSEDLQETMRLLAELRRPVDAFFEKVIVNSDDESLRSNRLMLLNRVRTLMLRIADFSRIEK